MRRPPPSLANRPDWLWDCHGTSIAVVGADGFIGAHVVALALAAGARVRAVCVRDPWRLSELPVAPELHPDWVELEGLDVDAIALLAYEPPASYEHEAWLKHELAVNTERALRLARSAPTVVFASSADVYGPWHDGPVDEDFEPRPVTPYAQAKLATERALAGRSEQAVSLRLATVYGPSEHAARAIPSFICALAQGRSAVVHGDGSDVRDYVHVRDVAAAIVACCARPPTDKVLNVGSGTGRSTMDVLRSIGSVLGVESKARFEPASRAPSRLILRTTAGREAIGYRPREDFATGLREEAEWLLRSEKT